MRVNSLPDISTERLSKYLSKFGYSKHKSDSDYLFFTRGVLYQSLLTIPNKKKIEGELLEEILIQAHIQKIDFVEALKADAKISVRESIVVFADILGFTEKMQELQDKISLNEYLSKFNTTFKSAYTYLSDSSEYARTINLKKMCHTRIFSDNILYVTELNAQDKESEVLRTIQNISFFQYYLVYDAFFLRGAIVKGDMYCDETILIGQPIIDAYYLESKEAKYPRIIVEESIIEDIKHFLNYYSNPKSVSYLNYLIKSSDGYWFINYLYYLKECNDNENDRLNPSEYTYYCHILKDLLRHKEHIVNNRTKYRILMEKHRTEKEKYAFFERILLKYEWAAEYHNYFCSQHFRRESRLLIKDVANKFEFESAQNVFF